MKHKNRTAELSANNKELLDEMKFYLLTGPTSESKARRVLEELEDHLLLAQQDGKNVRGCVWQRSESVLR